MPKMAVLSLSLFLVLLQSCCLSVEGTKVYKEDKLYESRLWKLQTSVLIVTRTEDCSIPEQHLLLLEQLLKRSPLPITHIKVTCEEGAASVGLVCDALSSHQLALRREEESMEGMALADSYSSDGEFVFAVLKFLLGEGLNMLSSYSDLKDFSSLHSRHLLLLTNSTTSPEFLGLLVAILPYITPIAIVTNAGCLPLNHRPRYYRHVTGAPTFHLWSVSGEQWIKLPQDGSSGEQRVKDFLARLQLPIIVKDYRDSDKGKQVFTDAHLHPVFVFPGLSGASDVDLEQLVSKAAETHFMSYSFIMADRSRYGGLAKRLFITDEKPYPHLVVLPYGDESRLISIEVDGQDTAAEADRVTGVLRSIAEDHIWSEDGQSSKVPRSPSITDPSSLTLMTAETEYSVLAIFCKLGEDSCIDQNYLKLQSAMRAVGGANVGINVGGMLVECLNEKDLLRFQLRALPSFGLYNHTEKKWYGKNEKVTTPNDLISLVAQATGISDLVKLASSSTIPEVQDRPHSAPVHPLLQEDDHFGILVHTLPKIDVPDDLKLTSDNMESVLRHSKKTAVVFYMRWDVRSKVFLHHVMAAWNKLDRSLNASLGTVNCEDYTDVCSHYGITTYPTVLVFTPSTLHTPAPLIPSPSGSTLTSQLLLRVLGQGEDQDDLNTDQDRPRLMELTPATLPGVIKGTLTTPLIVWCDSHVTSDGGQVFAALSLQEEYSQLAFAWMDSSRYGELLKRVTGRDNIIFPAVVALNLDMRAVYHLPAAHSSDFSEQLTTFINQIKDGSAQPTHELPPRSWLPLKPPLPFPSANRDTLDEGGQDDHQDGYLDHQEDGYLDDNFFEDEFLFDVPPMDTHPHPPSNRRPGNPIHRRQRQQPDSQGHGKPPHSHNEL